MPQIRNTAKSPKLCPAITALLLYTMNTNIHHASHLSTEFPQLSPSSQRRPSGTSRWGTLYLRTEKYSDQPSGSRFVVDENTIIIVREFCGIPITADDVPFQTYHSLYQAVSGVFWGGIDNYVARAKLVISCCKRVHPYPVLGCALIIETYLGL